MTPEPQPPGDHGRSKGAEMPLLVQVGWRSKSTGEMCSCPVYERSPHANSEPVMVPLDVFKRAQGMKA